MNTYPVIDITFSDPSITVIPVQCVVFEKIAEFFSVEISFVAETELDLERLCALSISVCLTLTPEKQRFLHGFLWSIRKKLVDLQNHYSYSACLVPHMESLQHQVKSRTFIDKTVPEIAQTLLEEAGFRLDMQTLPQVYDKKPYVVQYQETTWHFLKRLLLAEGIVPVWQHGPHESYLMLKDSLALQREPEKVDMQNAKIIYKPENTFLEAHTFWDDLEIGACIQAEGNDSMFYITSIQKMIRHQVSAESLMAGVAEINFDVEPVPISGAQIATVVGPPGEAIHIDAFGNVQLQFHWQDSDSKEKMHSAWTPIAQMWAGMQQGFQHLLHVGQMAFTQFIGGDVMQPVVGKSVADESHMPQNIPMELHALDGMADRSGNQLLFSEKHNLLACSLHAKKNLMEECAKKKVFSVQGDWKVTVGGNQMLAAHAGSAHSEAVSWKLKVGASVLTMESGEITFHAETVYFVGG